MIEAILLAGSKIAGKFRIVNKRGVEVTEEVNNSVRATLQKQLDEIVGKIILADSEGKELPLIETLETLRKVRLVTALGDEIANDTLDAIRVTSKDLVIVVGKLFEWTSSTWIAAQALTADGVQLSDEKTQAVGGGETQVFGAVIEPPRAGTLVAVELGLTCQLKSGEATVAKTWQWKARNKGGTWVTLHAVVSENLTTAYVEKYRLGNFYGVTNFNEVPFEVGLFCTPHASTALATIISQVKNSSYATVVYKPS